MSEEGLQACPSFLSLTASLVEEMSSKGMKIKFPLLSFSDRQWEDCPDCLPARFGDLEKHAHEAENVKSLQSITKNLLAFCQTNNLNLINDLKVKVKVCAPLLVVVTKNDRSRRLIRCESSFSSSKVNCYLVEPVGMFFW